MKKYSIFAVILVLTLSVFTGCGCRRQVPETLPSTEGPMMPTTAITEQPTTAATENTTENTTAATDNNVIPDGTDSGATEDTAPGNAGDSTTATGNNNARSRARRMP